jgi:exopolysaccharide production protein ExoY
VEYVATAPDGPKPRFDPRVNSHFARCCRRFSLDELPQLLQVVAGRMSLVGPRPITAAELHTYYGVHAAEVLRIHPGMTGLWQVKGRNRLSYGQRRRLDLFYARRRSVGLYVRVLALTIPAVIRGSGAW